jgi:DNA-binding GntR family transcriptional regulator
MINIFLSSKKKDCTLEWLKETISRSDLILKGMNQKVDVNLLDGVSLSRSVLRDEIAETLKAAILRGRLRPGQRLNEKQLASELRISRAPLREAFWKLKEEGFITKLPHKGAVVTEYSRQDVEETFMLRILLETTAARLAAERVSQGKLDASRLSREYEHLVEQAEKEDMVVFLEADYDFHHAFWVMSGNRKLEEVLVRLCTPLFGFVAIEAVLERKYFQPKIMARRHRPILEAIQNGPPNLAEHVVEEAISGFRDDYLTRTSQS